MKSVSAILLVAALLATSGCDSSEYIEDLDTVPVAVLNAAREAVPGLVINRVEREETRRGTIYEVYGTANGRYYELEIGADGTVFEVEIEDDDD